MDDPLPHHLREFLQVIVTGSSDSASISERVERLVSSIGQDICRAATNGKWTLPKHILVSMTLHHFFRSSQLNTLMNRLGHTKSYTFTLELETALASAIDQASGILSIQIVRNPAVPSVFHSDFDNVDHFIYGQSGGGSIHTAHGIMLQELETGESSNSVGSIPTMPFFPRSGRRSHDYSSQDLPHSYANRRVNPEIKIIQKSFPGGNDAKKCSDRSNLAWIITHLWSSAEDQEIPGWSGFISELGKKPARLTTNDYYSSYDMEFLAFSLIFIEEKDWIPRTKEVNGQLISSILIIVRLVS